MSEEAAAAPAKKKGGKLPIIIVAVAVLAGGGFFMTKSKGGKAEKPAVELGDVQTMPEFLVNLKESGTYLRTEIALQTKKGIDKDKFDKMVPSARDAIIATLTSQSLEDVRTLDGKEKLKKAIAKAVNDSYDDPEAKDEAPEKDAPKDKKVIDVHIHTDWDSQTGPVLKVFFTSFTTQ